jgi:hypothetical protein
LIDAGPAAHGELRRAATAFAGAWPYLELIAGCVGRDPLDAEVVEAYWLGGPLLDRVDLLAWGNSSDDRFRARAGFDWDRIAVALNAGGVPNHAFHVFCAYPWVGLLQSGAVDQALRVLDRCRIRWGRVVGTFGGRALVRSAPLVWDGHRLSLGSDRLEDVQLSVDPRVPPLQPADTVALHWDYICQRISARQLRRLEYYHSRHLAIANGHGGRLAARVES